MNRLKTVKLLRLLLPALLLSGALMHHAAAQAQPVPGPIRFIPQNPESSVRIDARFPRKSDACEAKQPRNLHAAYKGVLEVGRRADGSLYLVSELTFPEYLSGIAEVPRSWPIEALKAQVVAARTYAISRLNPASAAAREIKYDICATDSCQVYRGLSVEKGPWGDQWARAVAETRGQILEYNGKPAETFYFSTSDGKTHSNKDAFGGSPLPYLKPVEEADDTQSPLSNWTVRMPLGDLTETLRLANVWTAAGPIEDIDQDAGEVKVSGGGSSKTMTVEQFRARVNSQAVCLVPKRYPTSAANGVRYPQVVPSKWMKVQREGSDAVMTGRGWGHGVGMVQWGLKGKAERGQTYDQMLSHYYGGLRPSTVDEPGKIRVLLATGVEEITVERRGAVNVTGGAVPEGPVKLTGGLQLAVAAGGPIGPALRMDQASATSPANPSVVAQPATGPPLGGGPGTPVTFAFDLSSAASVHIKLKGPDGAERLLPPEPRDAGKGTIALDAAAAALPSGTFEASLEANDGVDVAVSGPFQVIVVGGVTAAPGPVVVRSPDSASRAGKQAPGAAIGDSGPAKPLLIGVLSLVVLTGLAWVIVLATRHKKT